MFDWLTTFLGKKLFGIESKPRGKYDDFSVEYYPRTGVYYAKYNGGYLKKAHNTGIVEVLFGWSGITYGTRLQSEESAWHLIDLFIEQRFKETVQTIRRT